MSIVIKLSETRVKVQGSVSSANAAIFEEELFSAISGQDLTIDAEDLVYISSAGLRVLLKAKKNLKGQVVIENVSPEVYEILDMTGFTEILTVRKALRQICVDGFGRRMGYFVLHVGKNGVALAEVFRSGFHVSPPKCE